MQFKYEDIEKTILDIELVDKYNTPNELFYERALNASNPLHKVEFWTQLASIINSVKNVLKAYKNPQSQKLEIKWYHFLFKKELRDLIFQLIMFVIGFIKNSRV